MDYNKLLNQVVVLDLVSGKEITTKILKVEDDYLVCKKPLIFVPSPDNNSVSQLKIVAFPYGAPLYKTDDS